VNFDFGEVLTRAGQITWKHKILWLSGIILALIGFLSLPISLLFNDPATMMITDPAQINERMGSMLLANGLIMLISIASIPVYIIGMTIPTLATYRIETGNGQVTFLGLAQDSLRYFWRVLGIFGLIWLGSVAIMMALFACIGVLAVVTFGLATICMFPIFLLFIPIAMAVYAFMEQAISAVVVDDLRLSAAMQRAWDLVKKNIGVMALLSIIIYLGATVVSMVIAVPMMIPMFSSIFSLGTQPPDAQFFENYMRNITLWVLAFSPLYALFQGVILTFMQSAWTLTYMRLARPRDNAPVLVEANA
jgi:hypothetical protein